jgi:histidinol-phosphatase
MSDHTEWKAREEFALAIAREASALILSHYQSTGLNVELKGDESPVTVADRGAEELLRDRIGKQFPDDRVLGEEFGETGGRNDFRWILDPIDGTMSFVHGVPLFGTLIGLEAGDEAVMGVCRIPALDEVAWATRGQGTWWQTGKGQPRRASVTDTRRLDQAMFSYTAVELFDQYHVRPAFDAIHRRCHDSRAWGDCYGHLLVATGRCDLMVDPIMNVWDAAPLLPILQEAGGHFIDWNGRATIRGGNGISVNAHLKHELLQIIDECGGPPQDTPGA